MSIADICALPVYSIAADNSVLLLWTTFPFLRHALEVIDAWGFVYKTSAFTWVKKNKKADSLFFGMGHHTRSNAELCLLATRGKGLKRVCASVHSVIMSRIELHSKKPDEARNRIVRLYGDVPRIELFARSCADGWDATGQEFDGIDIRDYFKTLLSST